MPSGFGDYTDGFSPPGAENVGVEVGGCAVDDDLSRALGSPDEARLATALEYLASGSCQAQPRRRECQASTSFEFRAGSSR